MEQKHFVLVHGAGHGAWTWYRIKPLLEAASHRVTVLDMVGAGINRKAIQEVKSVVEYAEPLLETMASVGPNEKVILVGHSFGGISLAVAMEKFPEKISASVFLTAFAPDTQHKPSYVVDRFIESVPKEIWADSQFCSHENRVDGPSTSFSFGPKCLADSVYQLSSPEDVALAKALVRQASLFPEELGKAENFTEKNYGSVKKVYVVCNEDKLITPELQKWIIQNYGIENVMEIEGADHMAMFSKPLQLFQCLLQVARNYT